MARRFTADAIARKQTRRHCLVQHHALGCFAQTEAVAGAKLPKLVQDEFDRAFMRSETDRIQGSVGTLAGRSSEVVKAVQALGKVRAMFGGGGDKATNHTLKADPTACVATTKMFSAGVVKAMAGGLSWARGPAIATIAALTAPTLAT